MLLVRATQLVKPGWADRFHDAMKRKKAEGKGGAMIIAWRKPRIASSLISAALLLCGACSEQDSNKSASSELEKFVGASPIGTDADFWIEIKNLSGEWERTGLIFGYYGDKEECVKAIRGLKSANDAREYRCEQANIKAH